MLDGSAALATEITSEDKAAPVAQPTEARIPEKDMDKLAEKVGEAAKQKSPEEIAEQEATELKAAQVKAFRRAQDKADRDRGEGGKFKAEADSSKDAAKALKPEASEDEKNTAKAETKDQSPKEEAKAVVPPEKPDTPAIKAPHSWSADKKAMWETLPPEAKAYVSEREAEAHKQISQLGKIAKSMEPIARTLHGYKDVFESKGLSFEAGMDQLLAAQRLLDKDPVSALQKIAQVYGVDLGQSLTSQRDPAISQLQAQVDRLTSELQESRNDRQQREQTEAQTKKTSISKVIDEFAKDKPEFAELEAEIIANVNLLNESNPELSYAEKLAKAYERAEWANPKTRAKLIEKKAKELEAESLAKAKAAAEQARRATSINVTSAADAAGETDLRSLQQQAFRRAQSR